MARIGLVLGAGGVVGAAFHDGVLHALRDVGWDPRAASIIVGTSAGSHVGAMLRGGVSVAAGAGRGRPTSTKEGPAPSQRAFAPAAPGLLLRGLTRPGSVRVGAVVAGALPAGRVSLDPFLREVDRLHRRSWPEAPLWLPAVRLRDGARVVFGRGDAPEVAVGRAVAASCAIPGYFTPVTIDGERYVDGGVHSTTNLDLLAGEDLDLVVVSAPMGVARGNFSASAVLQGRGVMRLRLAREAAAVRRSGVPVVAFSPTPADLEVMGWNAMSGARRSEIVARARASAAERLRDPRWRERMAALRD